MDQKKTEFLTLFRTVSELKNGPDCLKWAIKLSEASTPECNWQRVVYAAAHVTTSEVEGLTKWMNDLLPSL